MLLLSKTVTNHLKSNLFSSSVITFFAGCSAFVQISTDNIKGIIDTSLFPYSTLPKNDLFIKTGKVENYMGGSSFTVPVEVTITEKEVKPEGDKELRIITPLGWMTTFEHKLGSERMSRISKTTADYGADYCMPMTGLKSVYTNYWVRPKLRFKGVWDAEFKDGNNLIAKDNFNYRRECAEYTEEHPINDQFIGRLVKDYVTSWLNDTSNNGGIGKGLVIFVKGNKVDVSAESKKEELKKEITPFLKNPANETNGSEDTCKSNEGKKEQWCVADFSKGWLKTKVNGMMNQFGSGLGSGSGIEYSSYCGLVSKQKTGNCSKGLALEGIYGSWKPSSGGKKADKLVMLQGTKEKEFNSLEYIKKNLERRKSKLKIEIEEKLRNSEFLDVRKILNEFRKTLGNGVGEQVAQIAQTSASTTQQHADELWVPLELNPWIKEAASRTIKREADVKKIFNKYRLHQDNQLKRRKRSPKEREQLKFNIHKSVQLSNVGITQVSSSSSSKDNTFDGHSFKVIAYEEDLDRGVVNPIKIIQGNPLFRARENQEKLLTEFIRNYDEPFYSPSMIPMLRMISRAKYSDSDLEKQTQQQQLKEQQQTNKEYRGVRNTLHWWVDYLQYPWRDTWNIPAIKATQFEPVMYTTLQLWLEEIFKRTWSSNGSRIIFNFTTPYKHYILSKELLPALYVPISNFKTIGYIDQPTSSFTVISPEYAKIHGLEPISDDQYKEFRKLVNNLWLTQETWEGAYKNFTGKTENKKHLVNVGEKQMIIVGTGQTPDLLYPVQSWITIQPDKNKEALIYVDNYGFNDLKDRGTVKYQEQYITIGLPENVLAKGFSERQAYKEKLKKFIDQKMGEYKNYYHITLLGEDEGSDQLYAIRNSYIPTFQTRIGAVSYILSCAVYVVVLLLLLILIKKYLQSNMYLFGNFVANGMIKVDVLLNICLFTLVPLAIATTIGFLLSWAMQSSFYSIVSAFWYLTVQMNPLGATNALYFIFKVLAFMVPISYFYSRYALKDNVSALLKTTASLKVNRLTLFVYRIIYKISAMWKFKSVLVFNTFGQSGILSMTSVIGFIFLNFFLHNHGQFSKVSKAERTVKEHEFELDFETPTQQSGEYNLATYEQIGQKINGVGNSTTQGNGQDKDYYSGSYREPKLLEKVWEKYTGKPLKKFGKSEECSYEKKLSQGVKKVARFDELFCLVKKNGGGRAEEWTIDENGSSGGSSGGSNGSDSYYIRDKEIYSTSSGDSNGGSSSTNLKTLLQKYPNYWIISARDQDIASSAMDFFKGKTLMRVLLDIDFEYTSDTGYQKYNIWDQQSKELEKIQPILQKMDEKNYDKFIEDLVKSKYGPLFVSKFMKKHESSNSLSSSSAESSAQPDQSKVLARQGDKHEGKKSWYFKGTDIGREEQSTNQRTEEGKCKYPSKELKKVDGNGSSGSTCGGGGGGRRRRQAQQTHSPFEAGIYHLDSKKIVFFNTASDADKEIFIIYNPEFLYLILTAVEDFAKQREAKFKSKQPIEYSLPIKYTFGNIVHSADTNGEAATSSTGTGGVAASGGTEPEYYSSSIKNGGANQFDPKKTPDGDQTYTWSQGKLKKDSQNLKEDARIVGLKQDKRGAFYKLYEGDKLINSKLYGNGLTKVNSQTSQEPYPILINKFAARKHNLKVGDLITFQPDNHYTRFTCQLKPTEQPRETSAGSGSDDCQLSSDKKTWTNKKIKENQLKVAGIFDSYYKEAYFMAQKDLNKILGLNEDKGFNGIFTPKRDTGRYPDQLSVSLSSYSVSGIYTIIQQKTGNAAFNTLFESNAPFKENGQKKDFYQKRNYKIFEALVGKSAVGYDEFLKNGGASSSSSSSSLSNSQPVSQKMAQVSTDVQKLTSRISQTFKDYPNPMGTALLWIMNHSIVGDVVFNNLSNLTNNVSYLIIFVIFPLLLISLITIVYLLIKDLENVFVTMKLLGFGTKENSMPIIVYLLFLLFLSSFIGSLVVPMVLGKYVDVLFNSQSILLPLITSNVLMGGVFGILAAIYLFSIFRSYVKIKGIYLPVSIKLLVG